jgi:hypothetical protein
MELYHHQINSELCTPKRNPLLKTCVVQIENISPLLFLKATISFKSSVVGHSLFFWWGTATTKCE